MLDIGWTEIVIISVVALVVLGPKELPRALKTFGAVMAKARGMAREFQSGVDEMIRETELDELRKDLEKATKLDFDDNQGRSIDPTSGRQIADKSGAAKPAASLPRPEGQLEAVSSEAVAPDPEPQAPSTATTEPAPAVASQSTADPMSNGKARQSVAGSQDDLPHEGPLRDGPPLAVSDFDRDYGEAIVRDRAQATPGSTAVVRKDSPRSDVVEDTEMRGDFLPPDSDLDGERADRPIGDDHRRTANRTGGAAQDIQAGSDTAPVRAAE